MKLKSLISIVVPAHNEARFLRGLLQSIRRFVPGDVETVVVDNGSSDDTSSIARDHGCLVTKLDRRAFPSVARNAGVRASSGEVLVFLDADVEVTAEWGMTLTAMIDSLRAHPMVVTGDQYHISQRPGWLERVWFDSLRAKTPTYIDGGNLITTRQLFDKIGGFAEHLETSEDVDFCTRAVSHGAQLQVNPGFKVFHEGYPKTATGFVRRERWHGRSDFRNVHSLVHSKVAVAAVVFLLLHVSLALSLVGGMLFERGYRAAVAFLILIVLLCLASCLQKFRRNSLSRMLANLPVMYLYYVGRSRSALDALRSGVADVRARHR
ncbi:MAG TPA: glycosyltransferase [Steroidobacteraceae bacterium]|nr:glycosyltransferase [Steroidobacteraceae bacterium]